MELAGAASPTRGLFMGGANPGVVSRSNVVDFVTIATAGNAQDFGDLSANTYKGGAAVSSNTRAIHAGGNEPSFVTDMEFVTIATLGNSQDFGNLGAARRNTNATSSSTRGVISGGYLDPAIKNTMEYIQFGTTGNAIDLKSEVKVRLPLG